jgi:plastocyanin
MKFPSARFVRAIAFWGRGALTPRGIAFARRSPRGEGTAPPKKLFLLLLAFAALPAVLHADATIEGRVPLPKTRSAPVLNRRYEIVASGGVLSTNPPLGVAYLEGAFPKPAVPPVAQMAQKDLTFVPTLLPVQVGTKVEFPNFDDTYHNIFSYSPAKRFDLGRYRPDEKPVPSQLFEVAGLVTLHCDIHDHMRALILVLATPHFAVTDSDGRFRLSGLPAGHYTLKVWIDSKTTRELPVDLTDGATVRADFP